VTIEAALAYRLHELPTADAVALSIEWRKGMLRKTYPGLPTDSRKLANYLVKYARVIGLMDALRGSAVDAIQGHFLQDYVGGVPQYMAWLGEWFGKPIEIWETGFGGYPWSETSHSEGLMATITGLVEHGARVVMTEPYYEGGAEVVGRGLTC
jgi:hypothetical protein